MKEFHNQFLQLAERHISMDHTRCQLMSPPKTKNMKQALFFLTSKVFGRFSIAFYSDLFSNMNQN